MEYPHAPPPPSPLQSRLTDARARTAPFLHRTPLRPSRRLGELAGRPVYLKLDNLQKTGSFKVRGFMHKVLTHSETSGTGLLTFSSGNAAQGLAYAAQRAGVGMVLAVAPGSEAAGALSGEHQRHDG